jgi:hypothetical protein
MARVTREKSPRSTRYSKHPRRRPPSPRTGPQNAAERIAGLFLITASSCYLLAPFVLPQDRGDDSFIVAVSAHLGAWTVSHVILFTGSLLLVPAMLALILLNLLSEHRLAYGLVGGSLTLFGILATTVTTTIGLVVGQMAQMDDYTAMEALLYRMASVYAPFDTLVVFLWIGMLVLMTGLYRKGVVPWWPLVLLVIGTVLGFLPLASSVSRFFGMVGLAWLGFFLLLGSSLGPSRVKRNPRNVPSKALLPGRISHR